MTVALIIVHALAGLIVLAEALNKLERTNLRCTWMTPRQRAITAMKAASWAAIAVASAGAAVGPLMYSAVPSLADAAMMAGFAGLVVRSRLQEIEDGRPRVESDEFQRTQVVRRR
jgi:hypothetical protein